MRPDRIWRATRKIPPRRFHLMIHGRPPFARLKAALATSHPLWCELGGGLGGGGRVGKSQHHYFTDGSLFPATEIPAWVSALSRRLRPCLAGRNQPARSCWMPKLIGDTGSAGAPPAPASTVPRPAHPTPRGASCGGHQQLSARCGSARRAETARRARRRRDIPPQPRRHVPGGVVDVDTHITEPPDVRQHEYDAGVVRLGSAAATTNVRE